MPTVDVRSFLSPELLRLFELLTEYRLVRLGEIAKTDRAAYRKVERLRQKFIELQVPLRIRAIPKRGYVLEGIADERVQAEYRPKGHNPAAIRSLN
jgi:hypothetical protein